MTSRGIRGHALPSGPSRLCVALVVGVLLLVARLPAWGQVNQARGGITGLDNGTLAGGDGSGEARRTLVPVTLALVKQARSALGAVLVDNADVASGQSLFFVLYVDNSTAFPAADVQVSDLIDEAQFTYVAGTLAWTTVPSGSSDAVIWAGPWIPLTDAVGAPDDTASATDTGGPATLDRITIGAVAGQANQAVSVPGSSLLAFRFQVTVN